MFLRPGASQSYNVASEPLHRSQSLKISKHGSEEVLDMLPLTTQYFRNF
jgi:hypothetical protein